MSAEKIYLDHRDVYALGEIMANRIASSGVSLSNGNPVCYPVPRGGVPIAYMLQKFLSGLTIANLPEEADFFVDDIVDSGATRLKYTAKYPNKPFFSLVDRSRPPFENDWIVFPWELSNQEDDTIVGTLTNRLRDRGATFFANDNISEHLTSEELSRLQHEVEARAEYFLRGLLIDVDHDHNTRETAKRMAKMYLHEVLKGRYHPEPKITDFPNAKHLDELYTTGPISIRSGCSHHLVPILGKCWIGIVPGERVIGLSKFNRVVDWFASRAQIQEEMTVQIADFIEERIQPKGLAVVIKATHQCMVWRGVKEPQDAEMTTSVMRGAFRDRPEARAEFFSLAGIRG